MPPGINYRNGCPNTYEHRLNACGFAMFGTPLCITKKEVDEGREIIEAAVTMSGKEQGRSRFVRLKRACCIFC